ncbi:hypothetical protein KDK92_00990 [Oceanirhabdus seepicola]|uniref:Uncharacterized protein n=1 Tax=Oceanirhabdus seepicola TaxID=2828781 RepID=A0A9J6NUZ8_9CLOT|nr:hypothetical protein [Oceanirhabdus seepicola]
MDRYIWIKIRKHLKSLHPNKPFKWILTDLTLTKHSYLK